MRQVPSATLDRASPVLVALALVALAGCSAPIAGDAPADPGADRLGWEAGYWHDETVAVDASDGLDAGEREAVVARAMARVERLRGLEFEEEVSVSVVERDGLDAGSAGEGSSESRRVFEDAKFEALFLVGSDEDSIDTRNASRNRTVEGYYDPGADAIVVVSDSATPTFDGEETLAHELVHALQDQHFGLDGDAPGTRDGANAWRGLVEGEARAVERAYADRCGEQWACVASAGPDEDSGGRPGEASSVHLGVQVLEFFPYSDGPALIDHLREAGGWAAVGEAHARPPGTTTEVIYPERYGAFERRNVTLPADPEDDWERVRPPSRPDHGRLGQSALTAMFAYTLYDDYNRSAVLDPAALLNTDATGRLDDADPLNYDVAPTRGWAGDRLHVYRRGSETAYVWRLAWESPRAAERFAGRYRTLLAHWGGDRVEADTWRLSAESPFDGAVHVAVDGETVTIAKAPTRGGLGAVARGAR